MRSKSLGALGVIVIALSFANELLGIWANIEFALDKFKTTRGGILVTGLLVSPVGRLMLLGLGLWLIYLSTQRDGPVPAGSVAAKLGHLTSADQRALALLYLSPEHGLTDAEMTALLGEHLYYGYNNVLKVLAARSGILEQQEDGRWQIRPEFRDGLREILGREIADAKWRENRI